MQSRLWGTEPTTVQDLESATYQKSQVITMSYLRAGLTERSHMLTDYVHTTPGSSRASQKPQLRSVRSGHSKLI